MGGCRTGGAREPPVGDGGRRHERGSRDPPTRRIRRPGPCEPGRAVLRRHPRDCRDRPDRGSGSAVCRCEVAARRHRARARAPSSGRRGAGTGRRQDPPPRAGRRAAGDDRADGHAGARPRPASARRAATPWSLVLTAVATLVTAVILAVVAGFFALQQVAARRSSTMMASPSTAATTTPRCRRSVRARASGSRARCSSAPRTHFLLGLSGVSDVRVVIRLSRVSALDATGASVLADTIARLEARHGPRCCSPAYDPTTSRCDPRLRGVRDKAHKKRRVFDSTRRSRTRARIRAGRPHAGSGRLSRRIVRGASR